jgi:hypothetical protein
MSTQYAPETKTKTFVSLRGTRLTYDPLGDLGNGIIQPIISANNLLLRRRFKAAGAHVTVDMLTDSIKRGKLQKTVLITITWPNGRVENWGVTCSGFTLRRMQIEATRFAARVNAAN